MLGVTVNTDFLSRVLRHAAFARGDVDTGFLERHHDDLAPSALSNDERSAVLAEMAALFEAEVEAATV